MSLLLPNPRSPATSRSGSSRRTLLLRPHAPPRRLASSELLGDPDPARAAQGAAAAVEKFQPPFVVRNWTPTLGSAQIRWLLVSAP
ncbi:hypothetical protein ZWY2020_048628 [Hordeum vulgare]|nr:hypothetical protein ZWY2020_048628 [Hordeum vulgare]